MEVSTKLQQWVPTNRELKVEDLQAWTKVVPQLQPFSDETLALFRRFSQLIFDDQESRAFPELQALAFYMRGTSLQQMRQQFEAMQGPGRIVVPRGVALHFAPANVDSIFVYSWLLSALAGNKNVIRVSSKLSQQTQILLRLLNECLTNAEGATDQVRIITYDHDDKITEAISAIAHLRIIWGGDETVRTIRRIPLPPHAKELVFPDRHSMSILAIEPFLNLSDNEAARLAHRFYNDAYWFDQLACSSPRMVYWCGSVTQLQTAQERFSKILKQEIETSKYKLDVGSALTKLAATFRTVLDEPVQDYCRHNNELTTIEMNAQPTLEAHPGFGTIYQMHINDLAELVDKISRKDQTLTHFGFAQKDLVALAKQLNGRGADRLVPIGDALKFERFWDGYDLLHEMTRLVEIRT